MATPTNLPAAVSVGDLATASFINDLRGSFRVLQVIANSTATEINRSSSTFADTGLTATITPQSNTSKILVLVAQNGLLRQVTTSVQLRLMRGATNISSFLFEGATTATSGNNTANASTFILDSPATTSATVYKTMYASANNTNAVYVQFASSVSTIVLMEISA